MGEGRCGNTDFELTSGLARALSSGSEDAGPFSSNLRRPRKSSTGSALDALAYAENSSVRIAKGQVPLEEKLTILARLNVKLFKHNVSLEEKLDGLTEKLDTLLATSAERVNH